MTRRAERIGIDARYLSHGLVGGVHTYVHNLIQAMLRVAPDRRYLLYADEKAPFELTGLPPHATPRILPWRSAASSFRLDFQLAQAMLDDGVDVAHFPANYGLAPAAMPHIVTLHDAINLLPLREILRDDSKHPRHVLIMTYLHLMTIWAMRRSPVVVTVSHYSRREILRRTRLPADRVHVVYSAHDPAFRLLEDERIQPIRESLRLKPRVLLADAIKNPACTLRAYRALPPRLRDVTSLVFFARRQPSAAVRDAAASGECVLLVRPSRETLIGLYNLADLFVFPSWYEGFGLPVLEAMACGTPVIASSRGSLPEVTGEGGVIVDAEDHQAIARVIGELFTDHGRYAALREQALAWSARFSWERTALDTLQIYDEALSRHALLHRTGTTHLARSGHR